MRTDMRGALIMVVAASLVCLTSRTSFAKPYSQEGPAAKVGLVTASVLTSALYTPVKFVYATGGALVSGLDMGFSAGSDSSARTIAKEAVGGDWYVSPNVLLGNQTLHFSGTAAG